jgi:hypothetical protein
LPVEEDAPVANVRESPLAVFGEEGEGEVGGGDERAGGGRGGVRREEVVEVPVLIEEGEEGRVVEVAVEAEEGSVGVDDEPAEGDAGGGGAARSSASGRRRKISARRWSGMSVRFLRPLIRRVVEVAIGVEE